jgi:hypothetical protein
MCINSIGFQDQKIIKKIEARSFIFAVERCMTWGFPNQTIPKPPVRREFLKYSGATGGALLL